MVEKGINMVIISSYTQVILNFAVGRSECKVECSIEILIVCGGEAGRLSGLL